MKLALCVRIGANYKLKEILLQHLLHKYFVAHFLVHCMMLDASILVRRRPLFKRCGTPWLRATFVALLGKAIFWHPLFGALLWL